MTGSIKSEEEVKKTLLPNGLRVVSETIDNVRSVAVGIWVQTGSRHEISDEAGITHFLEHMLFKGTKSRNSFDIASSIEAAGGYLNAFTSAEYTAYYARCLDTELETSLDVLSDMVMNSTFPAEEVEKEKKVVIEEMKMYRDSPDDYVFEEFSNQLFKGHSLGRPIIGFEKTVNSFSRDDLYTYMANRYTPSNLLVCVSGNVDHDKLVELAQKYLGERKTADPRENGDIMNEYRPEKRVLTKAIEQTHYIYGRRGLSHNDDDRYQLLLVNTVLSGGMSARLHQNIREKYGYCYSINSFAQSFVDSGIFGVYVGTDEEYIDHVKNLIRQEFNRLIETKVSEKELGQAKTQLKGKLLLSQESMNSRMNRAAKSEIYYKRHITLDEMVKNIDAVSAEEIQKFSETFFNDELFSETILKPETKA